MSATRNSLVVLGLALLASTQSVYDAFAASGGGVPYQDAHAAGSLVFCSSSGRPVLQGNLKDDPFSAKAVSSYVPPKAYNDPRDTAFLLGFQPRQGVDPGQWSGKVLTANSSYTDSRHPSAQVLRGDITLGQLVHDFPPRWDGLMQIRLYLSTPNAGVYKANYAADDLRISGGRWQVVHPATLSCTSGTALSQALALGVAPPQSGSPSGNAQSQTRPSEQPPSSSQPNGVSSTPSPSASAQAAGGTGAATAGPSGASSGAKSGSASAGHSGTRSGDSSPIGAVLGVVGVLAALAAGGLLWRRRKARQ